MNEQASDGARSFGLSRLDPKQKNVLRIRALLTGLVPLLLLVIGDIALNRNFGFPMGWGISLGLLAYAFTVIHLPGRRYRRWGYHQGYRAIRIASGLLIRRETVVPYDRVQHIDVSHGPIERSFGVATLTLHTAGSYNSTVDLPGLAFENANRMRDEIRNHISQDPP